MIQVLWGHDVFASLTLLYGAIKPTERNYTQLLLLAVVPHITVSHVFLLLEISRLGPLDESIAGNLLPVVLITFWELSNMVVLFLPVWAAAGHLTVEHMSLLCQNAMKYEKHDPETPSEPEAVADSHQD